MNFRLVKANWDAIECDALIIPFFEDEDPRQGFPAQLDERLEGLLADLIDTEEWKASSGQIRILYRPRQLPVSRLILMGVGKREGFNTATVRDAVAQTMHQVKGYHLKKIAVYRRSQIPPASAAQAAVEGLILGTYEPDEYKTEEKSKTYIEEILFASNDDLPVEEVEEAMRRGQILAQATNFARSLVNEPGNRISPSRLAEKAREVAETYGLDVEVLGEPEMEEKGMNCILAVARGSDEPARLIVLRHLGAPDSEAPPIVFVGKGVTFDSGGLSLKTPQSMEEMKADKAGACAVLAAMQAVARLQVKRNVIGIIPSVENLPSGRATRPGDVIYSMSGRTVEVVNTDAEGRLILADALHYARALKPRYIVDLATLTGSCVVALGHLRAGLFCNDEDLYQDFLQAAEESGERVWRLPLDREYRKELESNIADIKNVGSRWGGAITAAKFLQEFVGDTPWCHIDMAGVDLFMEDEKSKGPTGFGVRTLAQLAYR